MRAALGRHERVDFVDDDRVDGAHRVARVRREHQVERFGRGDQDVGRLTLEARALALRRVAGADGDGRRDQDLRPARRDLHDAGQRRPQVAFDVHRQCFERRYVEHATSIRFRRRRREHQTVEAPEKGGQRLAAAGGRKDQRRFTTRDRGPAEALRACRRLERTAEPGADGRMKRRQWVDRRTRRHAVIL